MNDYEALGRFVMDIWGEPGNDEELSGADLIEDLGMFIQQHAKGLS